MYLLILIILCPFFPTLICITLFHVISTIKGYLESVASAEHQGTRVNSHLLNYKTLFDNS
jgi:hypothetical protein